MSTAATPYTAKYTDMVQPGATPPPPRPRYSNAGRLYIPQTWNALVEHVQYQLRTAHKLQTPFNCALKRRVQRTPGECEQNTESTSPDNRATPKDRNPPHIRRGWPRTHPEFPPSLRFPSCQSNTKHSPRQMHPTTPPPTPGPTAGSGHGCHPTVPAAVRSSMEQQRQQRLSVHSGLSLRCPLAPGF